MSLGMIATAAGAEYDVVYAGARAIDPETGLDAVRNIGITAWQDRRGFDRSIAGTPNDRCSRPGRGAGIHRSALALDDAADGEVSGQGRRHDASGTGSGRVSRGALVCAEGRQGTAQLRCERQSQRSAVLSVEWRRRAALQLLQSDPFISFRKDIRQGAVAGAARSPRASSWSEA